MKIPDWIASNVQECVFGRNRWSVARLFELSRDFPVMEINLDHFNVCYCFDRMSLREMVMHMRCVNAADLDRPIILDEDGAVMDGRHRIMKAMLIGAPTIKAVRFNENPAPCSINKK